MNKSEKILPSLYTLLGFPLKMSVFVCHSSDTDRLVNSLQKEITNQNNNPDNLVEWTIRDWHTIPHIQSNRNKDCQDVINEQLDNASIIVFVLKERIGHYLLREWFYSLRNLDMKSVIFFKNERTCHSPEVEYRIALMHPDHYLVPNKYKSVKDLTRSLSNKLEAFARTKIVDILKSSNGQDINEKIDFYTDQLEHLLTQVSKLGIKSIEGPFAERFERITRRYSSIHTENVQLPTIEAKIAKLNRSKDILPIRKASISIVKSVQTADKKTVK